MDSNMVYLVVYPIKSPDGSFRFKNSKIASKYIIATQLSTAPEKNYVGKLINRLFNGEDEKGVSFQTRLNNDWEEENVIKIFSSWLNDFGVEEKDIKKIEENLNSKKVEEALAKNCDVVDNKIHAKSIPTLIYDGKKHAGLYK